MTELQHDDGPRLPASTGLSVASDTRHHAATVSAPAGEEVEFEQDKPHHKHHTLVPRTLCFAGQLGWFAIPVVVIALMQAGRAEFNDTGVLTVDDEGRTMVSEIALVATTAYIVGWLWWATVAALNARNMSRHSMWVGSAFAAFVVQVAAVVGGSMIVVQDDVAASAVTFGVVSVVIVAHFTVMGSFRRTAGSIKARQSPWSRLIVLPWAAFAFNIVAAFFVNYVNERVATAILGAQVVLLGWYVLSFYQAMTTFDRGMRGTGRARSG